MVIRLRLCYFASLREAFGDGEELVLTGADTVAAVRARLADRGGDFARLLAADRAVRAALNQQLCSDATLIDADAELAFFPPVTGG